MTDTLETIMAQWPAQKISTWLARAYYEDDPGDVLIDMHDLLTTQLIKIYDTLPSEHRRETFRQAVGECMSHWAHSVLPKKDKAFSRLNEISILARETRSRPAAYIAYFLLSDKHLSGDQRFIKKCADILIDIVCNFIYLDDFFQAAHDIFYRSSLWQYQPTIFFRVTPLRRDEALRMLGHVIITISQHEEFFHVESLAVKFWRLFSPEDLLHLFHILEPAAVAGLISYFIESANASPVKLNREFGTEESLFGGICKFIRATTITPTRDPHLRSHNWMDDDLVADAYFLYNRKTEERIFKFPLGQGTAMEGLKLYEDQKRRGPWAQSIGIHH